MSLKSADSWFSKFIRLRDADDNGYVACIACGKIKHWTKVDCGHFIKRQFKSTRFDEKNCNAECKYCNNFLQGNDINYAKGLEKKYGPGIIEQLEVAKRRTLPMGKFELGVISDHYRDKFNELKKEKGL